MADYKWPEPPTGMVIAQEYKWPIRAAVPAGWSPQNNLNLFGYWRADNSSGVGASLVATDLSTHGRNASVPGGVTAPTIVTNVINGHSVFRFAAASNEYLSFGTDTIATSATAHIMWMVFKANSIPSSTFRVPLTYATASAKSQSFVLANFSGYLPFSWGGGDGLGASVGISGYDYSSAFQYFVAKFDGSGTFVSTSAWIATRNDIPQSISSSSGVINSGRKWNLIGAYDPGFGGILGMDGDIAEVGLAAAPSDPDFASLQTFLADRYSL